jgi:hypothetical protein
MLLQLGFFGLALVALETRSDDLAHPSLSIK